MGDKIVTIFKKGGRHDILESRFQKALTEAQQRGKVIFPHESGKVKDGEDHFPINDAGQARNALSRVAQYTSVPPWYDGTLEELQAAVRNRVDREYKGIEVTKP